MTLGKAGQLVVLGIGAFLISGSVAQASGAAVSAPAVSAAALHPAILAHRALYKMTLDSVRNGSHIQDIQGDMLFEWQDACDGWNVQQRLNLSMTRDEGDEVAIKSSYTTWESKDGNSYRFNYRNMVNGQVKDAYRGTARLDGPGQKGVAEYTVPDVREVKLPAGSYFPTAHTVALIDAAIAHKTVFSARVFDGTDEHGLSEINSVIGAQKGIAVEGARTGLGTTPAIAWPVRMAFFPYDQEEAEPDYEMDTSVLPNGVSEFMLMDYGEFRLRGTLQKIEVLPRPDC